MTSTECAQQRMSTGDQATARLVASAGIVRATISHKMDARRYNVARSDGRRDRLCSRKRSKLKPRSASIEAESDAKKSAS